jgi:hypothetical protein
VPQLVPQAPQFWSSVCVSTQAAPHCVSPAAQLVTHLPAEQASVLPQAVAQSPQWVGSLWVSTQAPEQFVLPPEHESEQLPLSQT